MTAKAGNVFLVKVGDANPATTYTAVMSSRTDSFTINNESIDATNKSNNKWSSTLAGFTSMEISLEGIFTGDAGEAKLRTLALSGDPWPVQIVDYNGTWEGLFTITSFGVNGSYNDAVSYSVSLANYGQVTYTAAP